jgi:hypothetical protein
LLDCQGAPGAHNRLIAQSALPTPDLGSNVELGRHFTQHQDGLVQRDESANRVVTNVPATVAAPKGAMRERKSLLKTVPAMSLLNGASPGPRHPDAAERI